MKTITACVLAIVVLCAGGVFAQTTKSRSASGRVTAVAKDSITIQYGEKDRTLLVDASTKVIGKGVGTAARAMKSEGRSPTVADLVAKFDSVRVTFVETEPGAFRATEIRIIVKGSRKP